MTRPVNVANEQKMTYEVEQKFKVADMNELKEAFIALGAEMTSQQTQVDRYFAHPARDFVQTDEAFRLRQVGDELYATYKGPKISQTTKTRKEIELPLTSQKHSLEAFTELFTSLGFRPVADIKKQRDQASLQWRNRAFTIAFDQVEHAGDFVEIEALAEASNLASVQADVLALAEEMQLHEPIRVSYLELVKK